MNLKLYRVGTVLKYIPQSWENSKTIYQQIKNGNRVSIFFDLLYWFYFYGHDYNDYCTFEFWNKSRAQKKSYISVRRNDKLRFALSTPEVYRLLLDKAAFNSRFEKYVHRSWLDCRKATDEQIIHFIKSNKSVIAKPMTDFGGHGIVKFSDVGKMVSINHLRGGGFLLEECIENTPSIRAIAPGSLNTIRIVTMIDNTGKLRILAALLRMGDGQAFTDNYHDGGMACPIDISTSRLQTFAYGMNFKKFNKHPSSGVIFEGYYIEGFQQCLDLVSEIAFVEPNARYVGWDFAITPNGIDLIEGNIPPGEDITQIAAGRGLWYEVTSMI